MLTLFISCRLFRLIFAARHKIDAMPCERLLMPGDAMPLERHIARDAYAMPLATMRAICRCYAKAAARAMLSAYALCCALRVEARRCQQRALPPLRR